MRPIPVAFHIWFLEVHTYGIGLALTFWFGLRYTERRLRDRGYPWEWVTGMFVWVIVSAIVGARAMQVLSTSRTTAAHPAQIFAIWQGGLSSFGGLILAVPVAIVIQRTALPRTAHPPVRRPDGTGADGVLGHGPPPRPPAHGVGRRGTLHRPWYGMYYAGEVGQGLPVPIFQAIGDFTIFGILLLVERWLRSKAPTIGLRRVGDPPPGRPAAAGRHRHRRRHGPVGNRAVPRRALWLQARTAQLGSLLVQIAGLSLVGRRDRAAGHAGRPVPPLARQPTRPAPARTGDVDT